MGGLLPVNTAIPLMVVWSETGEGMLCIRLAIFENILGDLVAIHLDP